MKSSLIRDPYINTEPTMTIMNGIDSLDTLQNC